MKLNFNIHIECDGSEEINQLGEFLGQLEESVKGLGNKCQVGATRTGKDLSSGETQAPTTSKTDDLNDDDAGDDSEEKLVERKTYFHHPESSSVFILEKGDTYPTDPLVEAISKKTYEELLEKYEGGEEDTGADDDEGDTIDFQKDLVPAFKAFAEKKGPAAAKALVTELGVQKLGELTEDQYPEAMKLIKDGLA